MLAGSSDVFRAVHFVHLRYLDESSDDWIRIVGEVAAVLLPSSFGASLLIHNLIHKNRKVRSKNKLFLSFLIFRVVNFVSGLLNFDCFVKYPAMRNEWPDGIRLNKVIVMYAKL